MSISTLRIQVMHILSFFVLLIPLLILTFQSQEKLQALMIPVGFTAGIGIGLLFYRFYLRKLRGDVVVLKGNAFPHITILVIIFFLSLPLIGAIGVLVEFGIFQEYVMEIILDKAMLISATLLLSCFLSSIIVELILLHLWERKHKIKLFANIRGGPLEL